MRKRALLVVGSLILLPDLCSAQRVIYDAARDEQAKAAAAAARDVTSQSVFAAQLKNLEELGKQQLDTTLRWQEVRMRASLNSFSRWEDVGKVLEAIDTQLKVLVDTEAERALLATRAGEIRTRAAEIRATLQEVRDRTAGRADVVETILSHLGDAREVVAFADQISRGGNPAAVQALNQVIASLEQVQKLHATVKGILLGHAAVRVPVASLRPDPLQTELELLRVEEEHVKMMGLIAARQSLDVGQLSELVDGARTRLRIASTSSSETEIENSLRTLAAEAVRSPSAPPRAGEGPPTPAAQRARLEAALYALHYAAAAAALRETPVELALLRRSLEERRYAIARSVVGAATYEQTVRAAAQRLALYWQSGFKPKDVADFLFHISSAVSLPIIAARQ